MVESTTIKITNTVRDKLLELKVDNEGYSTIIANLLLEHERLKADVEYLKEDKAKLYDLALGTSNSVALVNNIHRATYFITLVMNDISLSEEEKLQELKVYLSEMLEDNPEDVIATIENFKEMLANEKYLPEVLVEFENYVRKNY